MKITFGHPAEHFVYAADDPSILGQMSLRQAVWGWLATYQTSADQSDLPQIQQVVIADGRQVDGGETIYATLTDVDDKRLELRLTTDGARPRIECFEV